MNTGLRTLLVVRLFVATLLAALLSGPVISQAQTGNTATGRGALYSNTSGTGNTADGYYALYSNTTGINNTATGLFAVYSNTAGYNNTATGANALFSNLGGYYNTAIGVNALYSNTSGISNTALGLNALYYNTSGTGNTATGVQALTSNTIGPNNTANGYQALYSNTTGTGNMADGFQALLSNTTGSANIALGYQAGLNLTTGNYNIDIGNAGNAAESGVIRIGGANQTGGTYIAGITGALVAGNPVYITSSGQLGLNGLSSRRFKHDIKAMGNISDKLMSLRPVMFRYNDAVEKGPHALQYGLIAEEVAKVYPNLVQYDKAGKPLSVYYHLLTPMLLNELQKAHHRYEAQKTEISAMKAAHKAEITALKSELASLRQTQEQQLKVLAKLTAYVQTAQSKEPLQKAVLARH